MTALMRGIPWITETLMAVLRLLRSAPVPLSCEALAERLDLPVCSVQRVIGDLQSREYVTGRSVSVGTTGRPPRRYGRWVRAWCLTTAGHLLCTRVLGQPVEAVPDSPPVVSPTAGLAMGAAAASALLGGDVPGDRRRAW